MNKPRQDDLSSEGPYLIPLSAATPDSLKAYAASLLDFLKNDETGKKTPAPSLLTTVAVTYSLRRKEFPYRAAFVVDSWEELTSELELFIQGEPTPGVCFQGRVTKKSKNEQEEQSGETLKTALAKHDRPIIAQLWTLGAAINWSNLYDGLNVRRIPLPTYSFAKESCWIGWEKDAETTPQASEPEKNKTVGYIDRVIPSLEDAVFAGSFSPDSEISDHRVEGKPVVPGIYHLKMIEEAARQLEFDAWRFEHISWVRPIVVENPEVEARIKLYRNHADLDFRVSLDKAVCSKGKLVPLTDAVNACEPLQPGTFQEKAELSVTGERLYPLFSKFGLHYGPTFQGIQTVWMKDEETLAEIELTENMIRLFGDASFHPILFDCAFQSVVNRDFIENDRDSGDLFLPFSIQQIDIFKPEAAITAGKRYYVLSQKNGVSEKLNVHYYDLFISTDEGTVLSRIHRYGIRRFPRKTATT